jgi:uncharacterized membrane protein
MTMQTSTTPDVVTAVRTKPVESAKARLLAVDALRGVAILAMTLRHTAHFLGRALQAETYGGQPASLNNWPYWVSGLLANIVVPTFFTLMGVSLVLFINGRRRNGVSEWEITRYMLVRAGVLLVLDLTVCEWFWSAPRPYTHVLMSISIAMVILSVGRFLPTWVLATITLAMIAVYQVILPTLAVPLSETTDFWMALLFSYSTVTHPATEFSVFGWVTLPMLGFVIGQWITTPRLRQPRFWVMVGSILLVAWFIIRATNILNEPTPFTFGETWYLFFIMSKTPPSLTFMLFNLGLSALTLGALYIWNDSLDRPPMQWLVICGQASLFIFVAHIIVYGLAARFVLALNIPIPSIVFAFAIWFAGLGILIPLAYYYRRLRKTHPKSVLQYL